MNNRRRRERRRERPSLSSSSSKVKNKLSYNNNNTKPSTSSNPISSSSSSRQQRGPSLKKKRRLRSEIYKILDLESERREGVISIGYIVTKFGRLRVQFIGNQNSKKLVLFFHGSGSLNSSDRFSCYFPKVHALLESSGRLNHYFIVSVDCPGYAKSSGSKQAIRTYPRPVILSVIHALGYNKAYILGGRSQGGAAVFNALLERSNLCTKIVQLKPVFSKCKVTSIPKIKSKRCVLVYNEDDDGHPISIGRLIEKRMDKCDLISFSATKNIEWVWLMEHFPQIIVNNLK